MTHFGTDELRDIEHAFADVRDDASGLGERAARPQTPALQR